MISSLGSTAALSQQDSFSWQLEINPRSSPVSLRHFLSVSVWTVCPAPVQMISLERFTLIQMHSTSVGHTCLLPLHGAWGKYMFTSIFDSNSTIFVALHCSPVIPVLIFLVYLLLFPFYITDILISKQKNILIHLLGFHKTLKVHHSIN